VELDPSRTSLSGFGGTALFAKHAGKWQYNLQAEAYSPGFESNDVGFMTRSDAVATHAVGLYSDPTTKWKTRRRSFWVGKFQNWNFDRDLIQNGLWFDGSTTFINYWRAGVWGGVEASTMDDRATRGGPAIARPRRQWVGGQVGTDPRRPLSVSVANETLRYETEDGFDDYYSIGVTYRPTSNLSLRMTPSYRSARLPQEFVTAPVDATATRTFGRRYVFAALDQRVFEVAGRLDWTFTSRLSLQVYVQPYVVSADYNGFKEVAQPRSLDFHRYDPSYNPATDRYTVDPDGSGSAAPFSFRDPDFNYRSVRANAVVRWEFRPGSTLYFVWNESREDELAIGDFRFGRDVSGAFDSPSRDVVMVKVSYWFGM
jgi:hypothetical protein